jgi:hypothetical protein
MQMVKDYAHHWPWLTSLVATAMPDTVHWLTKMFLAVITGVIATVASDAAKNLLRARRKQDKE